MKTHHLSHRVWLLAKSDPEFLPSFDRFAGMHLMSTCPSCDGEAGDTGHLVPFRSQPESGAAAEAEREELKARAARDLATLEALPGAQRAGRIRRARTRMGGFPFAKALLRRARSCLPGDAAASGHWAILAGEVLRKITALGDRPPRAVLEAQVLHLRANAARVAGDFPAAHRLFDAAEDRLHQAPDLWTYGDLYRFEASLDRDERRLDTALNKVLDAALFFFAVRDHRALAETFLKEASIHRARGEMAFAVDAFRMALEHLESWSSAHPEEAAAADRLRGIATFGLAILEARQGHFDTSEQLASELEDAGLVPDQPLYRLRQVWLRGLIAQGTGQVEQAEAHLRHARAGFRIDEAHYDAALVGFDLATLYLEQGRFREARRLGMELLTTFQQLQVPAEAKNAASLLTLSDHLTAMDLLTRLRKVIRRMDGGR